MYISIVFNFYFDMKYFHHGGPKYKKNLNLQRQEKFEISTKHKFIGESSII